MPYNTSFTSMTISDELCDRTFLLTFYTLVVFADVCNHFHMTAIVIYNQTMHRFTVYQLQSSKLCAIYCCIWRVANFKYPYCAAFGVIHDHAIIINIVSCHGFLFVILLLRTLIHHIAQCGLTYHSPTSLHGRGDSAVYR